MSPQTYLLYCVRALWLGSRRDGTQPSLEQRGSYWFVVLASVVTRRDGGGLRWDREGISLVSSVMHPASPGIRLSGSGCGPVFSCRRNAPPQPRPPWLGAQRGRGSLSFSLQRPVKSWRSWTVLLDHLTLPRAFQVGRRDGVPGRARPGPRHHLLRGQSTVTQLPLEPHCLGKKQLPKGTEKGNNSHPNLGLFPPIC